MHVEGKELKIPWANLYDWHARIQEYPPPQILHKLHTVTSAKVERLFHCPQYYNVASSVHELWIIHTSYCFAVFICSLYVLLLCCMFQAFVLLVIGLTTSVVVIYYAFLLPVILEYSTPWVVLHLVTAHWLLINIVFHYFKAVFTSPGSAPQVIKIYSQR